MNNLNNFLEKDKINSQLERANIQKSKITCDIYREYELYLRFIRELLNISVENGLSELIRDTSTKNVLPEANKLFCIFEKKISRLIYKKLPLITVEQLKVNKIPNKTNEQVKFNSLGSSLKTKDHQEEKNQYKYGLKSQEPLEFQISEDFYNTSEYYQNEIHEKLGSLDLDKDQHYHYLSKNHIIENKSLEKKFISSLVKLLEEIKVYKSRTSENHILTQIDKNPDMQSLKNFDLIDKSLESLLLNLSYKINLELFKSNLIKNMISQHSFEFLVGNKLMIKHPYPFVINFEFNLNHSSNDENPPTIILFNISTVELEFKNLNLSVQRNKINYLKNQFQRLIKKETYWRQKEITLNKIR